MQRTPILIFCEGDSEVSYGKFLHNLLDDINQQYAINTERCIRRSGGSLFSLVKGAGKVLKGYRQRGITYKYKFLFIDTDINDCKSSGYVEGVKLANNLEINLIWQESNHEGFLLRHFQGYEEHNLTASEVRKHIAKVLLGYKKPVTASFLAENLTIEHVMRAASSISTYGMFIDKIKWS